MNIDEIFTKVVLLKTKTGKSYRKIATEAGISVGAFEKFTCRTTRRITDENLNKLVAYLESVKE